MHRRTTPKVFANAKELRKNLTPAEQKLWSALRNDQLGVNFRRQHAVGPYIADFCCIQKKLIIELDGGQHLEQEQYDAERTQFLQSKGYRVMRFWNNDVMKNLNGVISTIQDALRVEG
jgi:very-short-patch-repair endonuclease